MIKNEERRGPNPEKVEARRAPLEGRGGRRVEPGGMGPEGSGAHSLGVFSWKFGGVWSAGTLKCARLEFSGCRVTPRERKRAKMGAGEGKKNAKILGVRRRGVRRRGVPAEGVRRSGGPRTKRNEKNLEKIKTKISLKNAKRKMKKWTKISKKWQKMKKRTNDKKEETNEKKKKKTAKMHKKEIFFCKKTNTKNTKNNK